MSSKAQFYFDYNASAPIYEEVVVRMGNALREVGNPSSVHQFGRRQHHLVETARREIAQHLDAKPEELVFTSGATEANAMALKGMQQMGYRILVGATEHASVLKALENVEIIPVDKNGVIKLAGLEDLLAMQPQKCPAVSVMYANNETGLIQPLEDITRIVKKFGGIVHTDAVQALGRIPFSFKNLKVDLMSLSAHKVGGPLGVGALVVDHKIHLPALMQGGGQEKNRRPGAPNVAGIVGFSEALSQIQKEDWKIVASLRDDLEAQVRAIFPDVRVLSADSARLPNTTCLAFPGIDHTSLVIAMDLDKIAISAGAACSSGKVHPSTVLQAMGVEPEILTSSIRVSLDPSTKKEDVDYLAACLKKFLVLRQSSLKTSAMV